LNTGIAGSLNENLKIGEVVNVISEEFADLGIEKEDGFSTLFETGFLHPNEFPFEGGLLKSSFTNGWLELKKVHGVTSSKYHTHKKKHSNFQEKLATDVENMEGAAVFYVCHNLNFPCLQIRAISNYITPEGPAEWNIPLALVNLKSSILKQIQSIAVPVS
jgi:futalosine hydrolase